MGTPTFNAPPPRDYGEETRDTLEAQIDLAPELYYAEKKFAPKYNELELQNLAEMLTGTQNARGLMDIYENDVAPSYARIQQQAEASQREADVAAVSQYAPQMREALRSSNPENAALLDELNSQAMAQLAAGGRMAPEDMRDIQQQTRGAFSARGLNNSNASSIEEIMNQQLGGQQLKMQRQAFAQSLIPQNQGVYGDPFMAILGRPSSVVGSSQGFGNQAMGMGQTTGPSLFSPESPYAQDAFNTNYNSEWSTRAANNDARTAMRLGYVNAGSSLLSGAATAAAGCWVARAVYGDDNLKWVTFRTWLILDAPAWFRNLYMRYGERFAKLVNTCSPLKKLLRVLMDKQLSKSGYGI
jgi:hypothetical protein